MTHTKIEGKFYPLTTAELLDINSKLTDAELRVYLYLMTVNPFSDRICEIDTSLIAEQLGLTRRTIQRAVKKLEQLSLICVELSKFKYSKKTTPESPFEVKKSLNQTILGSSKRHQDRLSDPRIAKATVGSSKRHHCRLQSSEPAQDKESECSKTIKTIKTTQTEGVVEKFSEEEAAPPEPAPQVKSQNQESSPTDAITAPTEPTPQVKQQNQKSFTHISNTLPSPQKPQQRTNSASTENDSQIPQDLRNKLEELEIPLDGRVRKAMSSDKPLRVYASHDISQAYGAVAHIERTWETINNPRGVFLFQISRQPVEPMGARSKVKTAADWDFTLDYIKKMYPNNWQDAAAHFGVEVEV